MDAKTRMERQKDYRTLCCKRDCYKTHCFRHFKNHGKEGDFSDLNPYDEARCPWYLALFNTRNRLNNG